MTLVKICGITDSETAIYCHDNGADFIGLNFSPASVRKIDIATATTIQENFRKKNITSTKTVFLFYKNNQQEIREVLQNLKPDYIQQQEKRSYV